MSKNNLNLAENSVNLNQKQVENASNSSKKSLELPKYEIDTFQKYFGIKNDTHEVDLFFAMSDISKYLGFFYDHIAGSYIRITPGADNAEAEITPYAKKVAQDLIRNKLRSGVFSTPKIQDLRFRAQKLKDPEQRASAKAELDEYILDLVDQFDVEPVEFICDPNGKSIEPIGPGLWRLNFFQASPIFLKALTLRESGLRYEGFDWIGKFPHIELLLRNLFPVQNELEYFLNWLATCFASGRHLTTIPVIFGIQGTGKDAFFSKIVEYFYGERYSLSLGNEDLVSRFMPRKTQYALILRGDEILGEFGQKSAVTAKLKRYSGNGEIRLELKNYDSKTIKSKSNMIIFSNDVNPITIERSDRRFSVFQTAETTLKTVWESIGLSQERFFKMIDAERDEFLEHLVCLEYDLSRANFPMENEVRDRIKNETNMKIDVFADHIRNLNENFSHELGLALVGFFSQENWDQRLKADVLKKFNLPALTGPETNEQILFDAADSFWERLVSCVETHGHIGQTTLSVSFRLYAHTREKLDAARANRELERYFRASSTRIWDFETEMPDFANDERKKTRTWTCAHWEKYEQADKARSHEEESEIVAPVPESTPAPAPKPLEEILNEKKAAIDHASDHASKFDENGRRVYPLDEDGNPIVSEEESIADVKAVLGF